LFRYFSFPLFSTDKVEIGERAEAEGWGDIMDMTWFCHRPSRGRPCGICAPCLYTIEEGKLDREDNPLKHAPHTATAESASERTHAYPRELAAFPLPSLKQQKYWPPVARVDNVYGDKNVMCACIPVDAYKDEVEA
jgi:hypothetical protein